ncbi:TspO/MBR family protein [Saccharomonospora azurea]|uniref:TspO/MBR family protein n=1 Tax=Saccharomonospora azurea TaxID=40988 RepID=UPI00240A1EA3|nr:TspO/MBR family protein [Saccharomonospora azurea]
MRACRSRGVTWSHCAGARPRSGRTSAAASQNTLVARRRTLSLAVVVALDGAIAAEIATAARRDPVAAGLLAPYLAWSLYATALTAAVRDPDNEPQRHDA